MISFICIIPMGSILSWIQYVMLTTMGRLIRLVQTGALKCIFFLICENHVLVFCSAYILNFFYCLNKSVEKTKRGSKVVGGGLRQYSNMGQCLSSHSLSIYIFAVHTKLFLKFCTCRFLFYFSYFA